jgi:NRPS condensation-like uncharacterized protein
MAHSLAGQYRTSVSAVGPSVNVSLKNADDALDVQIDLRPTSSEANNKIHNFHITSTSVTSVFPKNPQLQKCHEIFQEILLANFYRILIVLSPYLENYFLINCQYRIHQ